MDGKLLRRRAEVDLTRVLLIIDILKRDVRNGTPLRLVLRLRLRLLLLLLFFSLLLHLSLPLFEFRLLLGQLGPLGILRQLLLVVSLGLLHLLLLVVVENEFLPNKSTLCGLLL